MDPETTPDSQPAERSGEDPTPDQTAAEEPGAPASPAPVRRIHWADLLVFILLTVISGIFFSRHAGGDLFSDEADYALASVRGFEANRWDRSDSPREPDRLVAARHYHAPFTVDLIEVAHRFGSSDLTIRMPFIVCGAMSIGLVYLCGLSLFDRRREIALACATLSAVSPAVVRIGSHGLPWSIILFELLALLWCLTEFTRDRRWGWVAGAGAALGSLSVTSEMFFVAVPAVLLAAPLLFWSSMRSASGRRTVVIGVASAVALFVLVAVTIWPVGLEGHAVRMLQHYVQMRHSDSFPVNVGQQIYTVAPKWSYLYWYWQDYKPFFLCYAMGLPAICLLAAVRRLHLSLVPVLALTVLLLIAAHRAHIIGPEYLAHCLPFLTLIGGYAVYAVSLVWRPFGFIAIVALAVPFLRWSPRVQLPGMDARAQLSRWPAAARFLGRSWRAGDKIMVGSQPVSVGRWYLVYQGGVPPSESQFQTMPIHAPKSEFLNRLRAGFYRYAAVSNMVDDHVDLDVRTRRILNTWETVWRSDERGSGPSRLVIYRARSLKPPIATASRAAATAARPAPRVKAAPRSTDPLLKPAVHSAAPIVGKHRQ